jgi:high-affinity iron transporter
MPHNLKFFALLGLLLALWSAPAARAQQSAPPVPAAAESAERVRQIWKLLDYIAVDYVGAVAAGAIISEAEYAEMKEFSATALAGLQALPPQPGQQDLITQATELQTAIAALRDPANVNQIARNAARGLLAIYPIPAVPAKIPDLAQAAVLYREHCASCHGVTGAGDGEAGAGMDPAPIAFTDHERARERSLFALFEVITSGLADTPMVSYQDLIGDEDRWALAFYISTFAANQEVQAAGAALWRDDPAMRARIPSMEIFTRTVEAELGAEIGAGKAHAVLAHLRTRPETLHQNASGGLTLARTQLGESLKAYQAGDARSAASLALAAYLDGFEPVEAILRTRDAQLLVDVETAMVDYRSRIAAAAPVADVAAQAAVLNGLFDRTEASLASADDAMTAFLGAFTILVREGVEALLVVVAMITFLGKVERRDVLPYVHAGWVGALVAGLVTWAVAAFAFDISGANRELTEGFSALFAAVILLAVGIWMHQKSLAGRWQIYLREKLTAALNKKSAFFFLFLLSFVAVYREVFETILFYIALWTRGNGMSILAGFAAGVVVLAIITVILLRTSKRLPISQFFAWSSLLIAALAIVLAGKGIAALQEAGTVPAIAVAGPRIEVLGIYPFALPLLAQAVVLAIAIAGYIWNVRSPAPKG